MKDIERALQRVDETGMPAATERFIARAAAGGAVDVAYALMDTPFGRWVLATTPRGLVRISFPDEPVDEVLGSLARRISPRVLEVPSLLDDVRRELDEYFTGARSRFDVPIDWRLSTGFALRVRRACARIPYGKVSTYAELAAKAGNPLASRAAGNALGANPIPVVVPCHRVLRTGGALGGYGGGLPMKERLLKLEGALA